MVFCFDLMIDTIVYRRICRKVELIKDVWILVGIGVNHFSGMIVNNVIDLVTENIDDLLECKFAKQERVRLKYGWKLIELDSRNTVAFKIGTELHIHHKVTVVAITLGDQKKLDGFNKL